MNCNLSKPALLTAIAALTLILIGALPATAAERQEHKELPAASGGTLTFKAISGSINIKTHDRDAVTYDASLKPGGGGWFSSGSASVEDVVFEYEHSGGNVTINVKWKDDMRPRSSNLNARHTLLIPSKYNVDLKTAGGNITGGDLNGQVTVHTSGGRIELGRISGAVKAHSSGGGISLQDVKGNADVHTSGGGITLGNIDGDVSARTSGGSIKVAAVKGHLKGQTSGGSITAELLNQIDQPVELGTSGGSIRLTVPAAFKADLDARTSGGSVECELPFQGTIKRTSLDGKVNAGGPEVKLRTSGGSIKLVKS